MFHAQAAFSFAVACADFAATYDLGKHYQIGLTVKNIFDTYYEYVWWDGAQTLHSPADGTNATVSLRVKY